MLTGLVALIAASLFTGAAAYVSIAEHPARLALDDRAMLEQWKPSYEHAKPMQAGLSLIGALAGVWTAWRALDPLWLIGALALFAAIPFTLLVVMPVNNRLNVIAPAKAGPESRALLIRWGRLHGVRSLLGAAALLLMAVATLR